MTKRADIFTLADADVERLNVLMQRKGVHSLESVKRAAKIRRMFSLVLLLLVLIVLVGLLIHY
jgi:hypothetical protein